MVAVVAEGVEEAPDFVVLERMWRRMMGPGKDQGLAMLGKGKSRTNQECLGHCSSAVPVKWTACYWVS